MNEQHLAGGETPGLESLHELRLATLIRDLVKRKGRMEVAKTLRVNYKVLAAELHSGRLTPRLCDALDRLPLIRELTALEEVREPVNGLARQVKEVERLELDLQGVMNELRQEIGDEIGSVSKKQSLEFERLSTRLSRLEVPSGTRSAPVLKGTDMTWPRGTQSRETFRETDPSLVTMEKQAGDEEVFGNAWPLVKEWRELRSSHPFAGGGVDWLEEETRLRELENLLIGEHELTLPPETYPWEGLGRETQADPDSQEAQEGTLQGWHEATNSPVARPESVEGMLVADSRSQPPTATSVWQAMHSRTQQCPAQRIA